ncbi:MAG: Pseudouridine synthase [Proteiniphilum acetatigenes]|uniref:Pseudouridine synthase n=1 Tax=Proteiniphilum acetatigenes TaxID=294710 RepID=A0A101HKH5_9BACT|nr:MAG: Pseudouridine synthase [Proteiniphilum acetatigenes]KUL19993.1 MAG: Pseudouridine synthase [Proteiniphilum sp. 51_7]
MTTNNEESRPKRQFFSANNERHAAPKRNYGNERRPNQEEYRSAGKPYNRPYDRQSSDRYYDRQPSERSYNRNWENAPQGNNYGNQEGAPRKRRPRVGERTVPQRRGPGANQGSRSWGGPSQQRSGQTTMGPGGKKLKKKKPFKQIKYKENADPNAPIRLNKYLANAGVCSRREADEFIAAGVVKVNGEVVTELGTKITRADEVMFHNQPVRLESKVYVLLNKPKGFVTTTDDPENRKTVMELVKSACSERIYPVGRLDRATTGVLLLTNDGDLASKLTHPKYEKRKIYQVWLDKPVTMEHMQAIADGIELEDGEIHADAISYVTEEDLTQVGIEIHSGKNRVVRRIFEKLGYRVLKLDRVYFAGLTKKKLSRGKWRYLSEQEVNMLRMGAFD